MSQPMQHVLVNPDDLEVVDGTVHENLEGWVPELVSDEDLRIALEKAFDYRGDISLTFKSGDKVEVLERQGEQAHIQFGSGQEGWVKASYLSDDPPVRVQLNQREEEVEKLKKEKAQLETELAGAKTAVIPNARHWMFEQDPEGFSRVVTEFLAG